MTRLYDRNFAIVFASQTCFVLANTLMAHYARWISFLGGNEDDIGAYMGYSAVLGLLARPWIGQWIDRLGARGVWAIGTSFFVVASLGNLWVDHLGWEVLVLRTMMNVGVAILSASSLTYVAQTSVPERRAEAIGVFGAAGFLGMVIGPYLGDRFLGVVGARSREDFERFFMAACAASSLATLLWCFVRPVPRGGNGSPVRLIDFLRIVRAHWPGTILLVNVTFGVALTIPFVFLSEYVDHQKLGGIGPFFVVYGGWGLFLRLVLREIPDRFGRRKVLVTGLSFLTLGAFSFLFVRLDRPWPLLVPALLFGTGHSLVYHTMAALALEPFPSQFRGAGSALTLMHMDLGLVGASILGRMAYISYDWLFVAVGCSCAAVGLLYASCNLPQAGRPSEAASSRTPGEKPSGPDLGLLRSQ